MRDEFHGSWVYRLGIRVMDLGVHEMKGRNAYQAHLDMTFENEYVINKSRVWPRM